MCECRGWGREERKEKVRVSGRRYVARGSKIGQKGEKANGGLKQRKDMTEQKRVGKWEGWREAKR